MKATREPKSDSKLATPPRLTIVVVNYNSWDDIERLVATLGREPELAAGLVRIVVVDNASSGPVPRGLLESPPSGLLLLFRQDNGGFSVGVNAGWRLCRSPWLLVLNPDMDLEPGWLGQALARIEHHEQHPDGPPGIVGFGLRNADGTPQGSVGVFPSLLRTIREQFIPRTRRKYQADWTIQPGPVDWVTGACMLVNERMLSEVGGMDEDFFLYHEEVALSRAAQDRGWRVEFDPGLQAVHRHPLQNRAISPKMRIIIRHSKLLYFLKHLSSWQFRALSWIVSAEAAIRGASAALTGRSQDRRAWRTIRRMARQFRQGTEPRGIEVLRLAEEIDHESEASLANASRMGVGGPHRKGRERTAKSRV